MTERFQEGFHPFVIPFLAGMAFVLLACLVKAVKVILQLDSKSRRKYFLSLVIPQIIVKNIFDIIKDCLLHVRLWKRNAMLGFMHSSIAFGWFMIILLGHIQVLMYFPSRISTFYYPIFFDYFIKGGNTVLIAKLLDLFLYIILAGIALAVIKRFWSRLFGMKRTARPTLLNLIGLYSLWAIFPLRFLAELCARSGNPDPTLWWAYSIALCTFMCVLPFSRYMHIPAEMMLIPLRNAGLRIRHARKGFSKLEVYSCPNCGVCIDACPMSVKKANIKDCTVYLNRQIRRGNEKRIEQISDKCLLCGKCQAVCQVGVEGPTLRIAQRATRRYNIEQDYSRIDVQPLTEAAMGSKVLYFAGCMTQLTPRIPRAMESVLRKAGVNYVWMDRDGGLCCGRPMLTAGKLGEAKQIIRKNEQIIKDTRAHTLILSCPICYKIFKEHYNLPGVRVIHHSQYLDELVKLGKLSPVRGAASVVWHDPCELGRGSGIYEAPRSLIGRCAELKEAGHSRAESICCGGSLGSLTLSFAQREAMTRNALKDLTIAAPDTIATGCPLCMSTFGRYSDRPVKDIAEILDESC